MLPAPVIVNITEADAERIAEHMVDKFLGRLSDPDTVSTILEVWSGQADQRLGKMVRRAFFWIVGAILLYIGMRYNIIEQAVRGVFQGK
jgi:hypothetical protein